MNATPDPNEQIAKLTFASVYPLHLSKVVNKGRTKDELNEVINWLTGFSEKRIQELIDEEVTVETFFKNAKLNSNADLIKGVICGYRIEGIENPLAQKVRYFNPRFVSPQTTRQLNDQSFEDVE